jgi:hypothetical protein
VARNTLTTVTVEKMLKETEPLLANYRRWIMRELEEL